MKKLVILLVAALCAFTVAAQQQKEVTIGNGIMTKDTRSIGNFEQLNITGPFDIRLISGEPGKVIIEGDKNITNFILTEVKDNVLTIIPQQGKLFKSSKGNRILIRIPVTTINSIVFNGSGSISSKQVITKDLKLTLNGSGNIDLKLDTHTVSAYILGSGSLILSGKTKVFNGRISGSGGIEAQELQSVAVNVSVNGSGNANVYCNKKITGRINGSGTITYAGEPVVKDLKRTGAGEFKVY